MSKRKKSHGKVKPSWVGKTQSSLLRRVEQLLTAGQAQRRITSNVKIQYRTSDYINGRTASARKEIASAAKVCPVDTEVMGQYAGKTFRGKIVRIRGNGYTVREASGANVRIPLWVGLRKL